MIRKEPVAGIPDAPGTLGLSTMYLDSSTISRISFLCGESPREHDAHEFTLPDLDQVFLKL